MSYRFTVELDAASYDLEDVTERMARAINTVGEIIVKSIYAERDDSE